MIILKEIEKRKDEALDEAYQIIRKRVEEEEITGRYQAFYPGIDVSNMVESMIESAVEESIKILIPVKLMIILTI